RFRGSAQRGALARTLRICRTRSSWLLAAVIRPPGGVESTRRRLVVTVFPHLAMDIAMTAMLVASLTSR
uniref:hypothetical protein n=1 Tax=Nocardia abscessus TaxID=120957 RepID=UPI00245807A6